MARGWESKSVEEQIEAAAEAPAHSGPPLTVEERQRRQRSENLRLARARVLQQIQVSGDPRYTDLLQKTLADLERQIAALS